MRALAMLVAAACIFWAVDRFEFQSRYSNTLLRAAHNQAEQLNYEVKRWFKAIS
jgi:hypothetical protein